MTMCGIRVRKNTINKWNLARRRKVTAPNCC